MALNCGHSTIKYLLFIFNLLCSLCGIALIVIGAVSLVKLEELREISDEYNIVAPSILLIVFGSVVFVISFFGCCGAIRESYCMTSTYSFFLILLVIAQIVIAVLVFVFVGDVTTAIKKGFERVFENRDNPVNADLVNSIQQNLQCCGKRSFLDYGVASFRSRAAAAAEPLRCACRLPAAA